MQKLIPFAILVVVGVFIFLLINGDRSVTPISQNAKEETKKIRSTMKITSAAFNHNAKIPSKYTCDGENINPPLQFLDVPGNAKSLALIVDDPDVLTKTASNAAAAWVHWVVYSIGQDVTEVEEDSIPEGGIEGMTDFGKLGYGGPCPPSGTHRYFFKLYALDTTLDLPQSATKQIIEDSMGGHIIDRAELIGLYARE